jgi:hypothetical protein
MPGVLELHTGFSGGSHHDGATLASFERWQLRVDHMVGGLLQSLSLLDQRANVPGQRKPDEILPHPRTGDGTGVVTRVKPCDFANDKR